MAGRSASCADCGATVLTTSAAPVVRAGAVVLLCGGCRGEPQSRPAPAPAAAEQDDEYDDLVISAEPPDESDDYDDLSISSGAEEAPGGAAAAAPKRNVVYSEYSPAVSGAIDTGSSPPDDPDSR